MKITWRNDENKFDYLLERLVSLWWWKTYKTLSLSFKTQKGVQNTLTNILDLEKLGLALGFLLLPFVGEERKREYVICGNL